MSVRAVRLRTVVGTGAGAGAGVAAGPGHADPDRRAGEGVVFMQITVEVADAAIRKLVQQRIVELFGDDSRYRETGARALVRRVVDEAAVEAVRRARDAIAGEVDGMAEAAYREGIKLEMAGAVKRGLKALGKLWGGFDPAKLTDEQRAWLVGQMSKAAVKDGGARDEEAGD